MDITKAFEVAFNRKIYFNVGIDDKFGFEAETDWIKVIEVLGRF